MENSEQLLRAAVRSLRGHLIEQRDLDSAPAGREAWDGAASLVTTLMVAFEIEGAT